MTKCEEVIITTLARKGKGVVGNPTRSVRQVYDKKGVLIAENDPELINRVTHLEKILTIMVEKIEAAKLTDSEDFQISYQSAKSAISYYYFMD